MKVSYRISKKALHDLKEIWLYTLKRWSKTQANKYFNQITEKMEFIALNPEKGDSREYIKSGYRSVIIKSHVIFYKKGDDGIIEIIRILHQKMDVESRLKQDSADE